VSFVVPVETDSRGTRGEGDSGRVLSTPARGARTTSQTEAPMKPNGGSTVNDRTAEDALRDGDNCANVHGKRIREQAKEALVSYHLLGCKT